MTKDRLALTALLLCLDVLVEHVSSFRNHRPFRRDGEGGGSKTLHPTTRPLLDHLVAGSRGVRGTMGKTLSMRRDVARASVVLEELRGGGEENATGTITFQVTCGSTSWGEKVGIMGSLDSLNDWQSPALMNGNEVPAVKGDVEYKYVIVDSQGSIKMWESFGCNRRLRITGSMASSEIAVYDGIFSTLSFPLITICSPEAGGHGIDMSGVQKERAGAFQDAGHSKGDEPEMNRARDESLARQEKRVTQLGEELRKRASEVEEAEAIIQRITVRLKEEDAERDGGAVEHEARVRAAQEQEMRAEEESKLANAREEARERVAKDVEEAMRRAMAILGARHRGVLKRCRAIQAMEEDQIRRFECCRKQEQRRMAEVATNVEREEDRVIRDRVAQALRLADDVGRHRRSGFRRMADAQDRLEEERVHLEEERVSRGIEESLRSRGFEAWEERGADRAFLTRKAEEATRGMVRAAERAKLGILPLLERAVR